MRKKVYAYIEKAYRVLPEYPWAKYDSNAVFRHSDNRKWFALVMCVERNKLGLSGEGSVDVINLKIADAMFHDMLVHTDGIVPAYHMNKDHWISVILDGTVEEEKVFELIDMSFAATEARRRS